MDVFPDIPYTLESSLHSLRKFDLYIPPTLSSNPATRPLICFVHGGAWRSEDKSDHSTLAKRLTFRTGFPVAVPNYRLTPREEKEGCTLRHPSHAEDILQFLEFLLGWNGPLGYNRVFDPKQLFLMGHSCSAHMLSAILLDSSRVTPSLTPSAALLDAVKGVIMSEGIYDLDMLIAHCPEYLSWFIAPAFGKLDTYARFTVAGYPSRRLSFYWLLIHSQGDTLVDLPQSEKMLEHLRAESGADSDKRISYNTSLTQGHDAILITDEFVKIAGQFVERVLTRENM
ncbi:Kynurenine formamidase [Leucoagaricus sp. SymC.cos]|nr:Kynurenine formamidase [Leucoagaricus sp. SymC.cos]